MTKYKYCYMFIFLLSGCGGGGGDSSSGFQQNTAPDLIDLRILGFGQNSNDLIRPLLGVSSGPTPYTGGFDSSFSDVSDQFRSLGVESVRTQDNSDGSFDVMYVFPDKNADATNIDNYDWGQSDINYQAILDINAKPFLRLGQSWRNMLDWGAFGFQESTGYAGYGPFWTGERSMSTTMVEKGPDIFTALVDRYTNEELWGFNPLQNGYVEIWNEPNIIGINTVIKDGGFPNPANKDQYEYTAEFPNYMWDGTPEQFYEFFANTAIQLKNTFPEIKIGGPGLHNVGLGLPVIDPPASSYKNDIGLEWTENFLSYLSERDVDLDFFSWHLYTSDPEEFLTFYDDTQDLLAKYGYESTEQVISEWNTTFANDNASSVLGAAQSNAIWIALQNNAPNLTETIFCRGADGPFVPGGDGFPVQIDANGNNLGPPDFGQYGVGLVTKDGDYKPVAHAFSYWADMAGRELVSVDQYYSSSVGKNGLYALGGLQSGSEGRDLRILTSYLSQADSPNQPIVVDLLEVAEQFNFDPSTISIYTIENQFGPPVHQEISNEGMFTLPEDRVVLIQMDDASDDPIINHSDGNTLSQAISRSVYEGANIVGSLVANQHVEWSLVDECCDSHAFSIDSRTGELIFNEVPDFENPKDSNLDNIYDLLIQSVSGAELLQQSLFVEVLDVNPYEEANMLNF